MANLVKRNFSLNLNVMQILGFYPPEKYKKIYRAYAYFIYIFFVVPTPVLTGMNLLLNENVNLSLIAENAFAVFETGNFVFKLLQFIISADKMKKCIYTLESPIFLTYTKVQEQFVEDCVKTCNRNSKLFLCFCWLTVISWAIVPLFGKEYKLPLDVWLPFDISSGGVWYTLSYIFIVTGVTVDTISNGAIDPLIGGLAFYASTQLKILKDNLQNMNSYVAKVSNRTTESEASGLKSKLLYEKLKLCIQHHKEILNFVEIYADTFSPIVFVQFAASVVVLCISCLQLSMVEPFTISFFSMIIFINAILMEILFYCYYGTILFEESNSLVEAAYMSHWYEYDMMCKKVLIILMERCKKPITVTSGKILDLSLDTFTTILKRSYSLLAVLKNYEQ